MKTLTWVDITRKSIKSKLGFGWSVQGIEKQNKVKTKGAELGAEFIFDLK